MILLLSASSRSYFVCSSSDSSSSISDSWMSSSWPASRSSVLSFYRPFSSFCISLKSASSSFNLILILSFKRVIWSYLVAWLLPWVTELDLNKVSLIDFNSLMSFTMNSILISTFCLAFDFNSVNVRNYLYFVRIFSSSNSSNPDLVLSDSPLNAGWNS